MDNLRRTKLLFFILVLLLIVPSCAGKKSTIPPKSSAQTTAHAEHRLQAPSQAPAQAVNLANKHMEAGEYQKAINAYNVEYRKHPQDQALVKEYVKSLEDMKAVADKTSDREDFTSAGKKYHILLKNYPRFKGFEKRLSFNSSHLNAKLSHCKQSLSTQGFEEYRKGNLSGAIALWQGLLAVDPHNTEIKDALRTANLQQKNLQENK
jgi:tetratricopeptide (TPR) repeat protein